jgi:hypothetical protein
VLSRNKIIRLEMETVADQTFGPSNIPLGPVPYLGYGVNHSLGVVLDFGPEVTDPNNEASRRQALNFISTLPSSGARLSSAFR